MKRYNKEVTLCFVDFRKAFDSISRETMFEILPLYGIPHSIVEAVKCLYTNTSALVLTPDGETTFFNIEAGVLQGDTLAPFLFIVVLDYVLRLSLDTNNEKGLQLHARRSSRHPAQHLTDLDFADDLAITTESVKDAESLLQSLEKAAALVGLHCNEAKTEFITTSIDVPELKSSSGVSIKQVQDFKYLGAYIIESPKDFRTRKALAWDACNKLDKIWCSNINNNIKVQLFTSLIEPILTYGAETWTLTTKLQKRMDGTYTNLLRRAQNIHWSEHATKQRIYGKLEPISKRLCKKRLPFAGHCHRATNEVISSLLLWRPTGIVHSHKLTYVDSITRDTGIPLAELGTAMTNREVWKNVVQCIPTELVEG